MKKLIDLGNNIVEVDKILGMSINSYIPAGPTNFITVTFKKRKEYIYNPNIDIYEMEEFNDVLLIEYSDFQTAQAYLNEFMSEWEAVLEQNN